MNSTPEQLINIASLEFSMAKLGRHLYFKANAPMPGKMLIWQAIANLYSLNESQIRQKTTLAADTDNYIGCIIWIDESFVYDANHRSGMRIDGMVWLQ